MKVDHAFIYNVKIAMFVMAFPKALAFLSKTYAGAIGPKKLKQQNGSYWFHGGIQMLLIGKIWTEVTFPLGSIKAHSPEAEKD